MATFMNYISQRQITTKMNEKGSLGYKIGVTENETPDNFLPLLSELHLLQRGNYSKQNSIGIERTKIVEILERVIQNIESSNSDEEKMKKIQDLIILTSNIRDIRGKFGKGEKTISHWILIKILTNWQQLAYPILKEIPNFGSFKDYSKIFQILIEDFNNFKNKDKYLQDILINLTSEQLFKDLRNLKETGNSEDLSKNVSLLAKWMPREKTTIEKETKFSAKVTLSVINKLNQNLESNIPSSWNKLISLSSVDYKKILIDIYKYFRKQILKPLMKHLGVVETKMCSKNWADIDFEKGVPGRSMFKYNNAFQNKGTNQDMFLNDPDRTQCALNYKAYLEGVKSGTKKIKANGVLYVHELVRFYRRNRNDLSEENRIYLQGAFNDIIDNLRKEENPLKNLCFMTDVSGSMEGDPMDAAIGITIVACALQSDIWKKTLTFHSEPSWVNFEDIPNDYVSQMERLVNAPWGGSTNFHSGLTMILKICKAHNIKQFPDLCVLTDMQWDNAIGSGSNQLTSLENLKLHLVEGGFELPKIYVWNLRNVNTCVAPVDSEFMVQIAGFSTNLLRNFLEKGEFPKDSEDTTLLLINDILHLEEYDYLRKIVENNWKRNPEEFTFNSSNSFNGSYLLVPNDSENNSVEAYNSDVTVGSEVKPSEDERLTKVEENVLGLQGSVQQLIGMMTSFISNNSNL